MYEEDNYFDFTSVGKVEQNQEKSIPETMTDPAPYQTPKKQGKAGSFFRKTIMVVSMGLCFGLFAGLGFYAVQKITGTTKANQESVIDTPVVATHALQDNKTQSDGDTMRPNSTNNITMVQSDISQMVEEVMPSMVSIVNNYTEEFSFFGQRYTQSTPASGSGIIIGETDDELLIATNYHVVENADSLEVTFIDDNSEEAFVKGTDPEMDLAVIAVSLKDLDLSTQNAVKVATLGNSESLRLGEPVVAIGNALGYGQSVTTGIISALNREVEIEEGETATYIQTDAAINGGNSGGALLNINGEVIGINSAKIGGSMVEGMGYAIPISSASPIISELMIRETRSKVAEDSVGYMGISMQEVNSQIAQAYNMPIGVFVKEVEEGSGAEKAGIMAGDIVTKVDGQRITSNEDLLEQMQYYAAGDRMTVTIERQEYGNYVEYQLEVTLGERPSGLR